MTCDWEIVAAVISIMISAVVFPVAYYFMDTLMENKLAGCMDNLGFALFLMPSGDIEVCKVLDSEGSYKSLYHKSYNAGESLKQNLLDAYDAFCEYEKESWENGK